MSESIDQTKINPENTEKPKPCCVCLDEKKKRDECLLFTDVNKEDSMVKCKEYIDKYKECMKSYGFEI